MAGGEDEDSSSKRFRRFGHPSNSLVWIAIWLMQQ